MLTRIVRFCFRIKESQQRPRQRLRRDVATRRALEWAREKVATAVKEQRGCASAPRLSVAAAASSLTHTVAGRSTFVFVLLICLQLQPPLLLSHSLYISLCLSHILGYPYTHRQCHIFVWVELLLLLLLLLLLQLKLKLHRLQHMRW